MFYEFSLLWEFYVLSEIRCFNWNRSIFNVLSKISMIWVKLVVLIWILRFQSNLMFFVKLNVSRTIICFDWNYIFYVSKWFIYHLQLLIFFTICFAKRKYQIKVPSHSMQWLTLLIGLSIVRNFSNIGFLGSKVNLKTVIFSSLWHNTAVLCMIKITWHK